MRNKKKIIRAVTVPNSIGFFRDVMIRQKAEGYETVVVTSPGRFLDDFMSERPDFRVVVVPMERRISIWKDIKSLLKLISVFAKERPYVVHSMTPKAGLLCMIAAKLTCVPIRIHTFTGLVWPTAVGTKRKILMATDKILCRCATHIIPEGRGVMNDLQSCITKKSMKVLGYGNCRGVDMYAFNPNRFVRKEHKGVFVFMFVSRIARDKGINELVGAFTQLHDQYPNTKLILVGRDESNIDPIEEITRRRIDSNPAIDACGMKFNEELKQMYVDADCFVMPSYREGFPNTVLEAGAMGRPSIVTDINGSREIVINNETGLIVPPKDENALYEAMLKMLTNEEERLYMASNARKSIMDRFEKGYVQDCQIQFYKDILN